MRNYFYIFFGFIFILSTLANCRFEQLENKKEISNEIERNTVKRFTPKQIDAEALRIGDSLTLFADSLLRVRLAAHLPTEDLTKALEVYPPEKYPEVKVVTQKYNITPKRLPYRNAAPTKAQVQPLSQSELLYTRPIYLTDASCLTCHGTEVTAQNLKLLQQRYPGFKAIGFKQGDFLGMWQFPIQRQVILERLTLKKGKSQRIRHLFTKQK